jgi:hypothetical protein
VGYYFQTSLEDCKQRNNQRSPKERVPLVGLFATYKKLVLPTWQEGFDEIYSVKNGLNYSFIVEEWSREN